MSNVFVLAHESGNPVIDADGATWVWEGADPPLLSGDFTRWESSVAPVSEGPGRWTYRVELPDDAYVEYCFFDEVGNDETRRADPLARGRVWNGLGYYNHPASMPGRTPNRYRRRPRGCPRGAVTRHRISDDFVVAGGSRNVWIYAPPDVHDPVPLLVVYDGNDYLQRGGITTAADALIHDGSVEPFAIALLGNTPRARYTEYCANDAVLTMLEYLVLPLVADHVPVTGRHAVLGASMGGLQALHTVLRWPERFETALTQGAAVRHYMPSEIRPLPEMLLRAQPPDDVRVWQQVGAMDFLYESNIEFAPSLAGAGEHELVVTNDAHTYEAWRHWLPNGLRFAFGR